MARVLVVDDDPSTVTAVTRLLGSDGYEVAGFTTGADAVEALSREKFDAIFTDLNMPSVDGRAIVAAAREHVPTACVVVVTAESGEEEATLRAAGACIVAGKPLRYDDVVKTMADHLLAGKHRS